MKGWLLNDYLTTIPGVETMFSHLAREIEGLTPLLAPFGSLHKEYGRATGRCCRAGARGVLPGYIIRNASYFRPVPTQGIREIAFLQDPMNGTRARPAKWQVDVCEGANLVVCNSDAMRDELAGKTNKPQRVEVIRIGVDLKLFKPAGKGKPIDVLYVGADDPVKGWDRLLHLIATTPYRYAVVVKREIAGGGHRPLLETGRVEVYTKIPPQEVVRLMQRSKLMVCTSRQETLHMAGVEGGVCDTPIVAMDVGIYHGREDGPWGLRATPETLEERVDEAMQSLEQFSPRQYWIDEGMDLDTCIDSWRELINE